jgi:hypothetical protein
VQPRRHVERVACVKCETVCTLLCGLISGCEVCDAYLSKLTESFGLPSTQIAQLLCMFHPWEC